MSQLNPRNSFYVCLVALFMTSGVLRAQEDAPPAVVDSSSAASPVRIETPLCRILDTAVQRPGNAADHSVARIVNFRGSRCSNIVSPSATAYVFRITTSDPADEGGGPPPEVISVTRPAPFNGELEFLVPSGREIAVDLQAFIMPPGKALPRTTATSQSATSPEVTASSSSTPAIPRLRTDAVVTGDKGELVLTADRTHYTATGALLTAASATPSISARLGTAADSAFGVFVPNTDPTKSDPAVMLMRGNGVLELSPAGFLQGRTDYYGTSDRRIAGNVVHDVTVTDALDADGGTASRIVFFNAHSNGENGSPAMTKFEAYTFGFYTPVQINFDSKFHRHKSHHYHFRAHSTAETKDTFWVKPATNNSTTFDTRADMYVSGLAGIGTLATTQNVLSVARDQHQITAVRVSNANPGDGTGITASALRFAEGATEKAAIQSIGSGSTGAFGGVNALQVWNFAAGAMIFGTSNLERIRVEADGDVGIGTTAPGAKLDVNGTSQLSGNVTIGKAGSPATLNITGNIVTTGDITGARVFNAVYQDVAEWVPATADLAPGTVVVLNTAKNNEVMASHGAYDTSVAGVVSEQPGLLLGVGASNKEMVATTGRVKVRVDARQSPIRVGDLLVTSDVPGTAMRSEPMDVNGRKFHQPGTIIGKALEPLEGAVGEILVLLSMQ